MLRLEEGRTPAVRPVLVLTVALLAVAPVFAQMHDPRALEADPATAEGPIAPRLEGLGDHHFEVTTDNPESQRFFDQGLRLTYGFNHSEALRAFKEAARLDPGNAMAYWGWALVLGPNLNLPMSDAVVEQAHAAAERALAASAGVSERERAYIEAVSKRYAAAPVDDRKALDEAYAEAMGKIVERYPEDLDAATLYAASLMLLSPWDYWSLDGSPKGRTRELLETLESVVDRSPRHAGALHYYIHAVESRHPERGESHADQLGGLMPGAGHMVHMPSHIYMRLGRYADSYEANARASLADESYITQCRAQGIYPLGYYPHNVHFMAWSAQMQGRRVAALAAARKVADVIPATLVADQNLWGLFDTFLSQPMFTMVRFGMWEEMLAEPRPALVSPFMNGVWHYGRALAHLHQGSLRRARKELRQLQRIRESMRGQTLFIGFGTAAGLLTIAEEVVKGEIAGRRGETRVAVAHLDRAVRLEDALLYNEPPDWYFPVRHYLGAMLLEAGRATEAEVVYSDDLRRNPNNGYSLFGLREALRAQGKKDAAEEVEQRFAAAWSAADHQLTSSRF